MPEIDNPDPGDLRPWDQQPRESNEAFQGFQFYRDAGEERSIRSTAAALGKSKRLLETWSSEHAWRARLYAWNLHQDRLRQRAREAEIVKMDERQAKQGQAWQGFGMQGLKASNDRWLREQAKAAEDQDYEPFFPMDATEAARVVESGMRMERVARGAPDRAAAAGFGPGGPAGGQTDAELFRPTLEDPDVKDAARELVRRAEASRMRESRGLGDGDEPEVPGAPAPGPD